MSLFPNTHLLNKKAQARIEGRIKCPFCITSGNRQSRIYKTKKQFLEHICSHNEVSESQKRAARYYASNYFVMLAGGMVE